MTLRFKQSDLNASSFLRKIFPFWWLTLTVNLSSSLKTFGLRCSYWLDPVFVLVKFNQIIKLLIILIILTYKNYSLNIWYIWVNITFPILVCHLFFKSNTTTILANNAVKVTVILRWCHLLSPCFRLTSKFSDFKICT